MTIEELKTELKNVGISRWELANTIGVHYQTLRNWTRSEKDMTYVRTEKIKSALEELKKQKAKQVKQAIGMTNQELTAELKKIGASRWELANIIGIHVLTLRNWLDAGTLPPEKLKKLHAAIEELKKQPHPKTLTKEKSKEFINKIKEELKSSGISQRCLAATMGVHVQTLVNWFNSETMTTEKTEKLKSALEELKSKK